MIILETSTCQPYFLGSLSRELQSMRPFPKIQQQSQNRVRIKGKDED